MLFVCFVVFGECMLFIDEEVVEIVQCKVDFYVVDVELSDFNCGVLEKGGILIFDLGLEIVLGGSGGYNVFYMDFGDGVFKIDGEWCMLIFIEFKNGQFLLMIVVVQMKQVVVVMFL